MVKHRAKSHLVIPVNFLACFDGLFYLQEGLRWPEKGGILNVKSQLQRNGAGFVNESKSSCVMSTTISDIRTSNDHGFENSSFDQHNCDHDDYGYENHNSAVSNINTIMVENDARRNSPSYGKHEGRVEEDRNQAQETAKETNK